MEHNGVYAINTISQLMRCLRQPPPLHPLVALVDYSDVPAGIFENGQKISIDFYKISFKEHFSGQVKYGQGYYDFDDGGLAFLKPGQVITTTASSDSNEGFVLYFHPDFIRNYPLSTGMSRYGFFSYSVSEALFLSAKEKAVIGNLFGTIAAELRNTIDPFSQDVLVSQIELLLNYSSRFYSRQFITRKAVSNAAMARLDVLLDAYFKSGNTEGNGLPTVKYLSGELKLSPRYLNDMVKSLTGTGTQQYIQNRVVEEAKGLLGATALSVAEIAYRLGFEHPQSFHKLFKKKTDISPLAFRQSFN